MAITKNTKKIKAWGLSYFDDEKGFRYFLEPFYETKEEVEKRLYNKTIEVHKIWTARGNILSIEKAHEIVKRNHEIRQLEVHIEEK